MTENKTKLEKRWALVNREMVDYTEVIPLYGILCNH